jgi:hypothetical protein
MSTIRICDICERPKHDEQLQKMTVVDSNGYEPMPFGGVMRVKRKFSIDICDSCLRAFKVLRKESED